jgi:hypothetical protein
MMSNLTGHVDQPLPLPRLRVLIGLILAVCWAGSAQGQLRIVSYNTLDKPTNSSDDSQLTTILSALGTTSVNGIAKRVDAIALQEQTNLSGNNTLARIAGVLNSLYGVNSYTPAVIGGGSDKVGFVYDASTISLENFAAFPMGIRPGSWLQVRPAGYAAANAALNMFSVHLKAGSSGSDIDDREVEAGRIRNFASGLGTNPNLVYLGDFNFGSSNEPGHEALVAPGNHTATQAIDPVSQPNWPNSSAAVSKFLTQSTRTSSIGDGGATGGMDDRFDLQYVTSALMDGEGLSYIGPTVPGMSGLAHSYRAFGNDGTSYNQAITSPAIGRSQPPSVLQALLSFSDHLPVVADYQLPAVMQALAGVVPTTLNVGEAFQLDVTVSNEAEVVAAIGADELDYSLTTAGDLSGSFVDEMDLALGGGNTHFVALDTSSPGMKSGLITVSSTSQAVQNGLISIPISFEVLAAGLAGDYNDDGTVDAADYIVWRVHLGTDAMLPNDPLGDTIDTDQYNQWRANFGMTLAGNGSAGVDNVPEPNAFVLMVLGVCWAGLARVRLRG